MWDKLLLNERTPECISRDDNNYNKSTEYREAQPAADDKLAEPIMFLCACMYHHSTNNGDIVYTTVTIILCTFPLYPTFRDDHYYYIYQT